MASSSSETRSYIRFEIVDFNGKALSKTVPTRHRDRRVYMYSGALAMGANSEVLCFPEEVSSAGCPNIRMVPDWSTEQVLPWAGKPGIEVRRVYCEQAWTATKKQEALPRTVCSKLLKELKAWQGKGLEFMAGGELEFTLAKKDEKGVYKPFFNGVDIFATLQAIKAEDYFYELEAAMEPVGVDITTINAEYGNGQLELTFMPKFGIEGPDGIHTFRTGAKEIAAKRGLCASFLTRPFGVRGVGNGGHFNFSLWTPDSGKSGHASAFHSTTDSDGLSPLAKHFLAGILHHAPAMEAFCAPTPSCYTRHGNWAPAVADWGHENRTACVRVKADPKGDENSCYMELRMPSACSNAYLVQAAVIAAGLDGLERQLELPPAMQKKEDGAPVIPTNLEDALTALEADSYMVNKLGKDVVNWYGIVKRGELEALQARLDKTGAGDEELSAAWQHMYMEMM